MIIVTPEHIKKTYELLVLCPPFNTWDLPDSSEITFEVVEATSFYGDYVFNDGHRLRASTEKHGKLDTLLKTISHEMCHLKQEVSGLMPKKAGKEHNRYFKTLAKQVCNEFGYDQKEF